MSLYIIHKANPYYKNGTILKLLTDGFQVAKLNSQGQYIGTEGLIMPEELVIPFCIKMLNRGFDDPKLRRKSGKGYTGEAEEGGYYEELSEELKWEDEQARLH